MEEGMKMETVLAILSNPSVVAIMISILVVLLRALFTRQTKWKEYVGYAIQAVRYAEKQIPDDTPNAGMKRFDQALKHVLQVWERVEGRQATEKEAAQLGNLVNKAHAEIKGDVDLVALER